MWAWTTPDAPALAALQTASNGTWIRIQNARVAIIPAFSPATSNSSLALAGIAVARSSPGKTC
eukprot:2968136-Lingulodinium_polyedra.AAC.1